MLKKRIMALICAGVCAVGLVGCTADGGGTADSDAEASAVVAVDEEVDAEESADANDTEESKTETVSALTPEEVTDEMALEQANGFVFAYNNFVSELEDLKATPNVSEAEQERADLLVSTLTSSRENWLQALEERNLQDSEEYKAIQDLPALEGITATSSSETNIDSASTIDVEADEGSVEIDTTDTGAEVLADEVAVTE